MKILNWNIDDTYWQWICCSSSSYGDQTSTPGEEKPMTIECEQPRLGPSLDRPSSRAELLPKSPPRRPRAVLIRGQSLSSHPPEVRIYPMHAKQRTKLQIGPPTEFRHVQTGSAKRHVSPYQPLELSIYNFPNNRLSPLLSLFGAKKDVQPALPPPLPAGTDLAMSSTIARKPMHSQSVSEGLLQYQPRGGSSDVQALSATKGRTMSPLSPVHMMTEEDLPIYQRLKSALYEKFELEERLKDIEVLIQRKSVYLDNKSASRLTCMRPNGNHSEPKEPLLAPPQSHTNLPTLKRASFTTSANTNRPPPKSAPASYPTSTTTRSNKPPLRLKERPLAPTAPPLRLQPSPPLHRKPSLTHVTTWLRRPSLDSIPRAPKPITSHDDMHESNNDSQPHIHKNNNGDKRSSVDTATIATSSRNDSDTDTDSDSDSGSNATPLTNLSPDTTPEQNLTAHLARRDRAGRFERMEMHRETEKGRKAAVEEVEEKGRRIREEQRPMDATDTDEQCYVPVVPFEPGRGSVGVAF